MSPPTLKLTYFDTPGRAEVTRLALFLHDIPFEDERLSDEAFLVRKPSLPFKQLPTLTINGEVFAQSHGMARYIGVLTGLYPTSNPLGAYRVDEILAASDDITAKLYPYYFEFDAEKKLAIAKELTADSLPTLFACVEARLVAATAKGPFLVGEMLSLADIELFVVRMIVQSGELVDIPTTLCDRYPRWNAIADAVAALPKIQAWYQTHP
ncbi:hypothetical protein SPRG_09358 [Saprolegnia parasitica CBS 223.65]|uniref:Glutathione S-transferase n=1 Tax=Saprolegnia parasitica (strain CBS 223.65) TaxID=695850 RepID=A0A067CFT6_SAPPC|nr:hypothetical protein SPRG_09358 [Saprolegnia parasitica CBS 223.65]KDO25416.1 hypothetical protein SPRG_09358 [Saprolegnia parasitica CBS 223.65]|eukprot:XP_012203843.1 hypothetical protein SPRG_09358 [Saprolegnia parasitica CBS 223.65]